jgi:hypothetical protein
VNLGFPKLSNKNLKLSKPIHYSGVGSTRREKYERVVEIPSTTLDTHKSDVRPYK